MALPVYTSIKLSASRFAIYRDDVYVCQLRPNEVASWIYRAEKSDAQEAADAPYFLMRRIVNALEYLEARGKRSSALFTLNQMDLF